MEEVLEDQGISDDAILSAEGEYYNLPTQNLKGKEVPFSVLKYVSEDAATHYQFVPIGVRDGMLEIGIVDPENIEARDAISFIVGKFNIPYKIFIISEKDFKKVIESYQGLSGEVKKALTDLETEFSTDIKGADIMKNSKARLSGRNKNH